MKSTEVEQVVEEIAKIKDLKDFWLAALELVLANPDNDQIAESVYQRDRERRNERTDAKTR